MLIGQVSKLTGLTIHTIRYYEKLGLFESKERRDNNYKEYPEKTVDILKFITKAKNLGFSISEIKEVIDLYSKKKHPSSVIEKRVDTKLNKIKQKILHLNKIKKALELILLEVKNKKDKTKEYDFSHLVSEIDKYEV